MSVVIYLAIGVPVSVAGAWFTRNVPGRYSVVVAVFFWPWVASALALYAFLWVGDRVMGHRP